ncbi:Na/Pi cotransporter family protein [Roseibium sp.]|uniref:Na/Pi cotransporter family protein n=1 Tax=Roseibium sp. TaxID=1936156 RepID=UPI003D0A61F0
MTILSFLIQLTSGAMLLLFSVRFMRIGIERLWSAQIRASLSEGSSHFRNVVKGTILGFVMQGATVVMLMAAGLAGAGAIPLVSAAVLALGADMGSALAVRFLQLPISAIGPLAILAGATTYLRAHNPRLRNVGRVVLGFGMILLSLSIIRTTVEPTKSLDGVATIIAYLNKDVITAALAGVVLTFVMHSSVAAVLTAVAFAGHSAFVPSGALGFVLGCNIGSALLPLWLLNAEKDRAKAVAASVAVLRSGYAILLVAVLALLREEAERLITWAADETMLAGHIAFNFTLLFFTPVCIKLCAAFDKRFTPPQDEIRGELPIGATEDISLALPALKRKLSAMLDMAAAMLDEVTSQQLDKEVILDLEEKLNASLVRIREIYAKLPSGSEQDLKDMSQILDFAIRIERSGDVLSGKLLALRADQETSGFRFSEEGQAEISGLVDAVRETVLLAHEAAWTDDTATAERLVRHKQHVSDLEATSRSKHLARLRSGNLASFDSSDQHLETIASLKEINSKFATIGYAILARTGGLKKTRLKTARKAEV